MGGLLGPYLWRVAFAALLLWAAALGVTGRAPVGSHHGAYAGVAYLTGRWRALPADAVIYHHSLGWHYDYYLFDAPQERRWWGTGWKLADGAAATAQREPGRPQWLALAAWEEELAGQIRLALSSRRLELAERERLLAANGRRAFTVYEIVPLKTYDRP